MLSKGVCISRGWSATLDKALRRFSVTERSRKLLYSLRLVMINALNGPKVDSIRLSHFHSNLLVEQVLVPLA